MARINFFEEDAKLPKYINRTALKKGLIDVAKSHGSSIIGLNYIMCSDEYLLEINKTYLKHHTYTDIITFPYQQGSNIEGDIFISIDRIKENAKTYSKDEASELLRVIAHGLLHLIGFKDKNKADKEAMRMAEDNALGIICN